MESAEKVYGRLAESVHASGYTLERAVGQFKWLIKENRWMKVGDGFDDINEFIKSIDFKEFKLTIDQRKEIALELAEIGASQRATAKMIGVDKNTIRNDIGENSPPEEKINIDNEEVINEGGENSPLEEIPKWITESGQKEVVQKERNEEKQKEKEERIIEEKNIRINKIKDIDIRRGDFIDVLKDVYEIDAIITDPPYPYEFIDCFSKLSFFASTHLKEDGFCIVYSGQYHLPEVIERLSANLNYVWTFCLYHKGQKQLVNGVNIMCGWKPILIFSNGIKKMRFSAYDIIMSENMEKFGHKWQQSESGVAQLVEIFSKPGELIVDPFSGQDTFLKVAHEMNRNTIGAEIK